MQRLRWFIALILTMAMVPIASAQSDQRCFPETNQCISGRIRQFWEQNGGLPVFGYPTRPQQEEQIEGKPFQVQLFERNRLELHPENARPYDVLLGRLGVDRLTQQGRDWFTFPKTTQQANCLYFEATGHNLCGAILEAWRRSGLEFDGKGGKSQAENTALFGQPISDLQTETIEGKEYQVQWLERARFELHPENQPPYNVLLGLLGNEIRDNTQAPALPAPAPIPQPKPLPPPTFNNCQADPNPGAAPNYPVQITAIDKRAETVTLKNVSPDPVNLDGWHMCSVTGNQEHPIGGALAAGETRTFPGPAGSIWSNSDPDPGALYNSQGQLVSYFSS